MLRRMVFPLLFVMCFCAAPFAVQAQEFDVFGRRVQVHGFASQGFVYTNQNNWLTMKTDKGSLAFTDFGANASVSITDKLRIGAQFYDRNVGNLGDWHPMLDWAYADYRFASWLGIRGGKVKTVFGLYNDTQDVDALHTFALLPQSIYPTDMRDSTIAHMGGDIYGDIPLGKGGKLRYTGFAGLRQDSQYGGYPYLLKNNGVIYNDYGGLQYGGDLRWETPIAGLTVGMSRMNEDLFGEGEWSMTLPGFGTFSFPTYEETIDDWMNQYYGKYTNGKLQLDAEYRRYWRNQAILSGQATIATDVRGWYVAGSYQVIDWLRLGTYFSRFSLYSPNADVSAGGIGEATQNDTVINARFDINRYINLKAEGHFMRGVGRPALYPSGFYNRDNPQGLMNGTNALVLRAGFSF